MIVHLDALVDVFIGVVGPYGGEVDEDHAHSSTHAGAIDSTCGDIGAEIHVVKTRRSAADHLRDGQLCAIVHKLGTHPATFGRPDMVLQPVHEWQVIGQATEQGHGGVRVGIDQSRDENVLRQFMHGAGLILLFRLITR